MGRVNRGAGSFPSSSLSGLGRCTGETGSALCYLCHSGGWLQSLSGTALRGAQIRGSPSQVAGGVLAAGCGLACAPGERCGRSANLHSLECGCAGSGPAWGAGIREQPELGGTKPRRWCDLVRWLGSRSHGLGKCQAWLWPPCLHPRVPVRHGVAGGVPVMVTRMVMVSHPCETQSSVTTLLSPRRHVGPPPAAINPARWCRRGQPGAPGAAEGQVQGEDGRWAGVGGRDGGTGGLSGLGGVSVPAAAPRGLAPCLPCGSGCVPRVLPGGLDHPAAPALLPSWHLSWPLLSRSHRQPRQTSLGPGLPAPPPGPWADPDPLPVALPRGQQWHPVPGRRGASPLLVGSTSCAPEHPSLPAGYAAPTASPEPP